MVIKLYISGISGNKEVKKKQQRVQMILDSKQINYEAIDITEPGKEKDKEFMQQNGKVRESLGKYPLPPQIFNDDDFCGDYEDFDMANEVDELEKFLHIETSSKDGETDSKQDEDSRSFNSGSDDSSHSSLTYNPYEYHTFKIKFDGVNGVKGEVISVDLPRENEEAEEVTKREVNGESEAVPDFNSSSENAIENVEAPDAALAKEEGSTQENKQTNDESGEKETEEGVEESEVKEDKAEESEEKAEEKEEKAEESQEKVEEGEGDGQAEETAEEEKEEEEEQKQEEESPKEVAEEEEKEEKEGEEEEEEEGKESEKEEKESDKESPESEEKDE